MTALSDFYEPVRFLTGDDLTNPSKSDAAIAAGLRTIVQMGLVPGYTLDGPKENLVPSIASANDWGLVAAQCALRFISAEPDKWSRRGRPYAESSEKSMTLYADLQEIVHTSQSGGMFFAGWQSLHSWLTGVAGLTGRDVGFMLTRLNVDVPIGTVTVTAGGLVSD
jgi:hypothetical protein